MNSYREKVVRNYIDGYNNFDIDKMLADFDERVVFENIQNGVVTLSLTGISAFKHQAELVKSYFSSRKQQIKSLTHNNDEMSIKISMLNYTLSEDNFYANSI